MHREIRAQLERINATTEAEGRQLTDAMAWVDSGAPLHRIAKPDVPPKHLVAYFPVVDGDYILLVDHKNAQRWLPTGGHVEPDEDPRSTVLRELQEELGLVIAAADIPDPLMVSVTETVGLTRGHTDVSLWYPIQVCRNTPLRFDAEEFNSVRWFHASEVPFEQSDPNLRHFLTKLQAGSPT